MPKLVPLKLCLLSLILTFVVPVAAFCAAPAIVTGGVVNSADFGLALSPGTMVSIFGSDLAPGTTSAATIPLPTTLDGVSVIVRVAGQDRLAPLFFVSSGQINFQLPYGLGGAQVEISVRTSQGTSNRVPVTVQQFSPRFFTKTMDGRGEALLVHHPSYRLVAQAAPLVPNQIATLFLTGLGEVSPAVPAGTAAGDGAGGGPLNAVPQTVEVWIGAQKATTLWAGLTPTLAGLYQIDLVTPPALPDGMTDIRVTCGGGQTQAGVQVATASSLVAGLAPEEVVQRSLEAQVRGDIDGMLSYWALDRYDAAAVADGRAALTRLRGGVGFSNFVFRHLATGFGDLGNLAVVRAEISFAISAPALSANQTEGIFAILVGSRGNWKIYSIDPDDLQNKVIYDRQRAQAPPLKALRAADGPRTPAQVSEDLNKIMVNRAGNEAKMTADGIMNRVGAVPGVGDVAAVVYQGGCVMYDGCQTVEEFKNNGFTPVFFLNASQVAVGVLQILAEPVPGLDTAVDMVQLYLDRLASMHEMRQGVKELAQTIGLMREFYNAWLFLPSPGVWKRPDGLEESLDPFVELAYGRPLQAIFIGKAAVIDKPIPFVVVGEVPVPAGLERVAEMMGAKRVLGQWKIPIDITMLALENGDLSTGNDVLKGYRKQAGPKGSGLVVAWKATCVRGYQQLKVALANGEDASGPEVVAKFMNLVNKLDVPQFEQGKLKVGAKQVKAFDVIGSGLQNAGQIRLNSRLECSQMYVSEGTSVAQLNRNYQKLEVEGLEGGAATIKVILPGSSVKPALVPDLEFELPVEVAGASGGGAWTGSRSFLFYNDQWNASMTATVETNGVLSTCQDRVVFNMTVLTCALPAPDPSKTDTYTVTVSFAASPAVPAAYGPGAAPDWMQFIKGQFDSDPVQDGGITGGTFVKTLKVERGKAAQTTFSGIIYYRYKDYPITPERWWAGGTVFRFSLQ